MSCKIRRKVKDKHVNEVSQDFIKRYDNQDKTSLLELFRNAFINFTKYAKITVNITPLLNDVKSSEFYEHLIINVAGLIIEQQVCEYMDTIDFKKSLGITEIKNHTLRGKKIHDIQVTFKFTVDNDNNMQVTESNNLNDDTKTLLVTLAFEVKSYNNKFGNITLTKSLRSMDRVTNPVYILCNYLKDNNIITITDIFLLLGSDINDGFDDNGFLIHKHLSSKLNKSQIFNLSAALSKLIE